MPLMSFHTQRRRRRRRAPPRCCRTDHGPGEPVVAGALKTLLERLVGGGRRDRARRSPTGYVVPFDPECVQAGRARPAGRGRRAVPAPRLRERRDRRAAAVDGVVFETKSGPIVISARAIVDCTGDGDVAVQAGAPFEIGRADGLVQPMTLMFRMVEFERTAFEAYVKQHPNQWRGVHGLWDLVREATAAGELSLAARGHPLLRHAARAASCRVNSTRVTRRARHRRLGSHAARSGRPPPDAPDRRVPAQVRAGLRAVVRGRRAASPSACARRGASSASTSSPPTTSSGRASSTTRSRAATTRSTSTIRQGKRHGADAPAARRGLRHPAALPGAAAAGPAHRRRPLHLRHPRGAFVVSRDADRDGHRPGGRASARRWPRAPARRCATCRWATCRASCARQGAAL